MFKAIVNIFLIPELRNRILFTLGMIAIYRIGFWIPLVGVDQQGLKEAASKASEGGSGWGQLLDYVSIFSGGSLQQSTIFGLGIMPYITASIIFQLLQSAPQASAVEEGGGQWPAEDYGMDPLCDHRHVPGSGVHVAQVPDRTESRAA
jgi:preprotein translocase subunit SecY